MVRVNVRPSRLSNRPVHEPAATVAFDPKWELDRLISCCLLGENTFYVSGQDIKERIFELAQTVDPDRVAQLAVEARRELGLRHAPLWLLVALSNRKDGQGARIREAARTVLRTPRDALDLIALYWGGGSRLVTATPDAVLSGQSMTIVDGKIRKPLPYAFKAAIRDGFARWTSSNSAVTRRSAARLRSACACAT